MNRKLKAVLSLALVVVSIAFLAWMSLSGFGEDKSFSVYSIRQGLDLRGGVSITYQAVKEDPTEEEMSDARNKLRLRVDEESTEADVYLEGSNRIVVDIPDVTDADAILKKLGKAGSIYFIYGSGNIEQNSSTGEWELSHTMDEIKEAGQVVIDGSDISSAQPAMTKVGVENRYVVELKLNDQGTVKFADATAKCVGQTIAIVYEGKVISAPRVSTVIDTGDVEISGNFDYESASELASIIRIGALPIDLEEMRSTVVGAKLGEEALSTSMKAGVIGIICIFIFMIAYYRIPGFAASIALCIYTGLMVFMLNLFETTITLQGIAGIILSIGMAVDANVIIFQRIREEIATGKTVRSSMKIGFNKALSAIVDGNVTTLIAALVLYFVGSGSVKGFAVTLGIGIVLSMFTALLVMKFILGALYDLGFDDVKFYGITKERKPVNFMKLAPKLLVIPAVAVIVCIVTMSVNASKGNGILNFGLDFKGGTSFSVTFDEEVTEELNKDLEDVVLKTLGLSSEIVKVTGENTYIIKTEELSQQQRADLTDALVEKYNVDSSL
ncbi:MAG: protein translocase subunit SecD, partial [Lachnospiraceae bacterium]|nr:protein translocase subunit SecD [Lachnospiraceae bacterium]